MSRDKGRKQHDAEPAGGGITLRENAGAVEAHLRRGDRLVEPDDAFVPTPVCLSAACALRCPRYFQAAQRASETYGVGNCESQLAGAVSENPHLPFIETGTIVPCQERVAIVYSALLAVCLMRGGGGAQ
jgi:hypothetical protein